MASDSTVAHYLEDDGEPIDLNIDEREEMESLRALLRDTSLWQEPSGSLEDSVVAAITGEHRVDRDLFAPPVPLAGGAVQPIAPPSALGSPPAPHTSSPPPNVVSIESRRLRYGARPASRWGNFAAGLVVAAVIVGGVLIVKHFPNSAQGTTSALSGQGTLADATGKVTVFTTNSGVRIELDATGLPRLDNDNFYEAWLKSADETKLVPVGTFHTGAKVTLWAGVSLGDYPTFTVTREHAAGPDDVAQESSGDVVLKGDIGG